MSVDGVGREAIIDCEEFEELTYYNDRIYVCDDAFNVRRLKLMHYPPANQTWDLRDMWCRHDAAMQRQTPDPIPEVSDEDQEDMDLPF
jgi:Icc-related predicted phosphoesterase